MQDLLALGVKYHTDKTDHAYLEHYATRFACFRHKPITLLEIGVMEGASLRMWRDWFPNARIYGIDCQKETAFVEDRIRVLIGCQEDPTFLSDVLAITGPLDIVVDDGSHHGRHHVITFDVLWPHLKDGGWYAIEDCQSIFNECWTQSGDRTMIDLLTERWPDIITGRDTIREVHVIGKWHYDGMIFLRKEAIRHE